ncbi:unnamed protein product [Rhizophagus irregularis]|nr:unnamed protein product [Rhizophagus irregularis]
MFRIDGVYYCWRGYYCVRYGRVSCHVNSTSTKNDFGKSMLVNTHRPIFIGPGTEIFTLGADNFQYHTENDSLFNYLYQINQFHLVQSNKASCKATEYSSDTLIQPKVRKKIGALASGGDSNFTRSRCLLIFEGHESEGVPLL